MKKLVISPHIDDEVLGCGGILDKNTFVLYCGFDETHIKGEWVRKRPDTNTRLKELNKVQALLKFKYEILYNKVNHYIEQDLIGSFEKAINEIKPEQIYIPNPSYNQDHKTVYDAAMVALRPHYFVPIDISKKIKAYKLMATQVRTFRSPEMLKALALLRGGQCNFKHAEGFEIIRWID